MASHQTRNRSHEESERGKVGDRKCLCVWAVGQNPPDGLKCIYVKPTSHFDKSIKDVSPSLFTQPDSSCRINLLSWWLKMAPFLPLFALMRLYHSHVCITSLKLQLAGIYFGVYYVNPRVGPGPIRVQPSQTVFQCCPEMATPKQAWKRSYWGGVTGVPIVGNHPLTHVLYPAMQDKELIETNLFSNSVQNWLTHHDSSFRSRHVFQTSAQSSRTQCFSQKRVVTSWKDCPTKSRTLPTALLVSFVSLRDKPTTSEWVIQFHFTAGALSSLCSPPVLSRSAVHLSSSSSLIRGFHLPWVGRCALNLAAIKTMKDYSPTTLFIPLLFLTLLRLQLESGPATGRFISPIFWVQTQ